ncbi:xanthine dehydrogenase/oxidase isoform X2 [Callorhinchus milii]|uniref:xanthine dehydrogenase/oxidase isoform X2 n=1 Tax=Callorhinchus milii TaxID=7868 RepID=UPI0004575483|nr:xanthine dehydrogenase/oxidase isoform X2 [Callorhinchus milii]|eukprot:gi/632977537/ref/XP_007905401.1/ PREDICTED: xanthine dehydrogenase/oxidase [Callorhinchus milii]
MQQGELNTGADVPDELVFFVNGHKVAEEQVDPEMTLLHYLRRKLGLTGTKLGCGEGGCGACTVMVSKYDHLEGKILHFSLNACLAPVCSVHHMAVTTVEGIGSTDTQLHPVQERISKAHGSQCGFCTPGIVMSMYALVRNNLEPTIADIEDTLQGNLCRCTGYRPILEGYRTFTRSLGCCGGNGREKSCCKTLDEPARPSGGNRKGNDCYKCLADGSRTQLFESLTFKPLVPTQEPDFPPELLLFDELPQKTLLFKGERVTWIQPYSLDKLLSLKARYPEARLVVGNTEVGIEMKFKNQVYPVILAPAHIPELRFSRHTDTGILFGAACTLTYMERVLRRTVAELPAWRTEVFKAVLEQLRWFAGQQIRNVAAVGGNIMTASPISDLNPVFMASCCSVTLASTDGTRRVWMDGGFFIGYRRTVLQPQEILLSIEIPFSRKGEYFSAFKQAQRREDDIAIVNCGMRVAFKEGSDIVEELSLSYGGMAATTISAEKTSQQLAGKKWNEKLLHEALPLLVADLPLSPSAPGGMVQFRRTLTLSFFFKFYLTVLQKLAKDLKNNNKDIESIPLEHLSATELFHRDPPLALQLFQEVPPGQDPADVVGRPLAHLSAAKQATGEAVYCDDMPHFEKELYLTLVTSAKAHARIISVDTDEALKMAGVVCFISSKDIPGSNQIKIIKSDETVFADREVTCVGHIIGAVVADTQHHAQMAAKAIKVTYEELKPIITIQDAIAHESYYDVPKKIERGNIDLGFAESDNIIEGEIHVGGQEHFYLETHCTVAVPKGEDGEMELFVSTQAPSNTQLLVAEALGVPSNRIVCRVKRLGGGFGGKESRSTLLALAVAVAAYKTKCPVRCMLNRDEDMLVTGGRHPFLGHYKVGFKDNGTIAALDVTCYCNAGNTFDLSPSVLERSLFHLDNSYMIPNFRGIGYLCKTNLASNTAFRGFGAPQGMIIAECWMNDIIMKCGLPAEQVRHLNLYQEGDTTHFNQRLDELSIGKCWEECLRNSHYHSRRKAVDEFNRQHRWKKRGLAIIPTKFGVSFGASFLNQAGALVLIYTDGSVLVTHGGTEMGQGLHTKMVQVASRVLGIPVCKIHISETSTNTVPNTSPTAASVSSDLNGMAIYNACQTLLERLKPFKEANPHGTWENWVDAAYMNTVSLSAVGFHRTPDLNYNWETNSGQAYNYFSYGVATSEVEIDCLTGDHKNLRTDIVMDVGTSLNPALDIGQVEGAFVQGLGLFTIEELRYSPDGVLYTRGPGTYKIPGFGDIPAELNVSLLRDSVNSKAIYSSKAVGEPPLFLAASIFCAIKDGIAAARAESGVSGPFPLDSPATPERIRNACIDTFTEMCPPAKVGTFTPWDVRV